MAEYTLIVCSTAFILMIRAVPGTLGVIVFQASSSHIARSGAFGTCHVLGTTLVSLVIIRSIHVLVKPSQVKLVIGTAWKIYYILFNCLNLCCTIFNSRILYQNSKAPRIGVCTLQKLRTL